MASISTDAAKSKRVFFSDSNGERRILYLGKVSQKSALVVKCHVENLVAAKLSGHAIDPATAAWLASLDEVMTRKLARACLIDNRQAKRECTLEDHLDDYFTRRIDVKQSTRTHWGHTKRLLIRYFGGTTLLSSITAGDARDWECWLKTGESRESRYGDVDADQRLATNTARKRVSNAKQFFEDAVRHEIIARNPFLGLKGTVGNNPARDFFVTRAMADKVLAASPDSQWRLLFALCRYGGLRCPSEIVALMWSDVDWDAGTIWVRSEKTKHHEGREGRLIPIFPELRPYLEACRREAEEGTTFVITRYRDGNANLRTQLQRIIKRAGLAAWPKLFQNLRASRATELASEFPAHVEAAWLGHSTTIARKHYLQVTTADFENARAGSPSRATQYRLAASRTNARRRSIIPYLPAKMAKIR
jgi:integrase